MPSSHPASWRVGAEGHPERGESEPAALAAQAPELARKQDAVRVHGDHLHRVAYSPAGTRLWIRQYRGSDRPAAVAVSPDGNRVYVTGSNFDTIAYKAATGTRLWVRQYGGSATALEVGAGRWEAPALGSLDRRRC